MPPPTLYGATYSVYVRAARLALAEKGVAYELVNVDIFGAAPEWYLKLHPFKRIPASEHDRFVLYEAAAILRYADEVVEGPALQPAIIDSRVRSRPASSLPAKHTPPG